MGDFKQITKYGILNPYGVDAMEGDWVTIQMKDGKEVTGYLEDVSYSSFTIRDIEENSERYLIRNIEKIVEVDQPGEDM